MKGKRREGGDRAQSHHYETLDPLTACRLNFHLIGIQHPIVLPPSNWGMLFLLMGALRIAKLGIFRGQKPEVELTEKIFGGKAELLGLLGLLAGRFLGGLAGGIDCWRRRVLGEPKRLGGTEWSGDVLK